ncbi:hypothetical protein PS2_028216 [Malus domestica]
MREFPPELLFEILLRLPPEDLLRCLCVSKAWNATIHDKTFIKSHLQRSIQTNSFGSLFVSATFPCNKCSFKFSDIYNDGTIERAMKSSSRHCKTQKAGLHFLPRWSHPMG